MTWSLKAFSRLIDGVQALQLFLPSKATVSLRAENGTAMPRAGISYSAWEAQKVLVVRQ